LRNNRSPTKIFVNNDDNTTTTKTRGVIEGTVTMMMAATSPRRKGVIICPIEEDADEEVVRINLEAAVQETVEHHQNHQQSAADQMRAFKLIRTEICIRARYILEPTMLGPNVFQILIVLAQVNNRTADAEEADGKDAAVATAAEVSIFFGFDKNMPMPPINAPAAASVPAYLNTELSDDTPVITSTTASRRPAASTAWGDRKLAARGSCPPWGHPARRRF